MILTACTKCDAGIVYAYEAGDDHAGAFDRQQCVKCGAFNYIQRLSFGGLTLSEADAIAYGMKKLPTEPPV